LTLIEGRMARKPVVIQVFQRIAVKFQLEHQFFLQGAEKFAWKLC